MYEDNFADTCDKQMFLMWTNEFESDEFEDGEELELFSESDDDCCREEFFFLKVMTIVVDLKIEKSFFLNIRNFFLVHKC